MKEIVHSFRITFFSRHLFLETQFNWPKTQQLNLLKNSTI